MKITTQQIKQIISEELDKLLYEEEDSNDVLRKAVEESITDNSIDWHYQKIKKFVIEATQDLNIQQQMQSADQMLQSNNNQQIVQAYETFLGLINNLIKPNEKDTEKQRETKEKISKQIESFEQFLEAEDQKSFLANIRIEAKDLSGVDLLRADLSGADLRGADLSGARLSYANLQGADLREADLSGAILIGVRYNEDTQWPEGFDYINSGAIGPKANLIGTNLSKVNLQGANLSKANLSYSDLSGAILSEANLYIADLYKANLRKANLSGANMSEAELIEADLRGADLSEADLSEANLGGVDLREANLINADLRGTVLRNASYDENTQWPQGFDPVAAGAIKE